MPRSLSLERKKCSSRYCTVVSSNHLLIPQQVYAAAIQPVDAKVGKLALMSLEYPAVLGSSTAGIVEALGPGVNRVAVGERVVCGTKLFQHKKPQYGGLQRFAVVDEAEIVEARTTTVTSRYELLIGI